MFKSFSEFNDSKNCFIFFRLKFVNQTLVIANMSKTLTGIFKCSEGGNITICLKNATSPQGNVTNGECYVIQRLNGTKKYEFMRSRMTNLILNLLCLTFNCLQNRNVLQRSFCIVEAAAALTTKTSSLQSLFTTTATMLRLTT